MEKDWILTKDAWPEEDRSFDFELKGISLVGRREGGKFIMWNRGLMEGKMSQIEKWKYHES